MFEGISGTCVQYPGYFEVKPVGQMRGSQSYSLAEFGVRNRDSVIRSRSSNLDKFGICFPHFFLPLLPTHNNTTLTAMFLKDSSEYVRVHFGVSSIALNSRPKLGRPVLQLLHRQLFPFPLRDFLCFGEGDACLGLWRHVNSFAVQ